MNPPPMISKTWVRWGLLASIWTAIGLAFAAQFYISSSRLGRSITWGYALSYSLLDWYVFALLSMPVVVLSRHLPIERSNWRVNVPLHLVGSAVFSCCFIVVRAW